MHEPPQSLVLPFPLHQVLGHFRRAVGGDLVHEPPQSLVLPFPLHQVLGHFRRAVGGDLVHKPPQSLNLPFPLHQVSGHFRCAAGGNVKILLPETEAQGLAGSGEQREEAAECAHKNTLPPGCPGKRVHITLAARFCYPSYLIFKPGSREPCSVLHLGNPVRYRRVPAERYRGLHTGSGNLPPGFPHPRRSWNRNPGF